MAPERIALVASIILGLSVSARAETIQVTIDKLVFTPAEVSAKVLRHDRVDHRHKRGLECQHSSEPARTGRPEEAGRSRLLLQASSQYEGTHRRSALRRG